MYEWQKWWNLWKAKIIKKKFKKLYSYTLQLHLLKDKIVEQASNAPMPPHSPTPLQYWPLPITSALTQAPHVTYSRQKKVQSNNGNTKHVVMLKQQWLQSHCCSKVPMKHGISLFRRVGGSMRLRVRVHVLAILAKQNRVWWHRQSLHRYHQAPFHPSASIGRRGQNARS